MISYILNGAWGKDVPSDKLEKALIDFGVDLKVELRKDGLSNIRISIDDEKILSVKKKVTRKRKTTTKKI